jgi:hypothetical protein
MSLDQLANLGEAIGGFAVVLSLLYLGYELRTNTKTPRVSKAAQSSESRSDLNVSYSQDPAILDLVRRTHVEKCESGSLSMEERTRWSYYCGSIMQRCEAEYFLKEAGIHPESVYNNRIANVISWMELPACETGGTEKSPPQCSREISLIVNFLSRGELNSA